jgi:hypothetical protein
MTERLHHLHAAPLHTSTFTCASPSPSHKSRATARGSRGFVLVFIEQVGLARRIRLTLLYMSLEFGVFGRLDVVSWNQKPHINWDYIRGVGSKCEYLVDEYDWVLLPLFLCLTCARILPPFMDFIKKHYIMVVPILHQILIFGNAPYS